MTPQQKIDDEGWTFIDWIRANTRSVTIGAVVVLVAAGGYWFYMRSGQIKRLNAERGLNQAKQSVSAGNMALAQADLQRIATRYKGTPSGAQAAMILAQIDYSQAKFAEGLKVLEPYQAASAAGELLPAIWALTADGQTASGKWPEAVNAYRNAAEATPFPGERAIFMAKTARALTNSGKPAEAREIWEKLAADPDAASVRNEAQIRLGELSVRPASKG